jgi:hypothetical protein
LGVWSIGTLRRVFLWNIVRQSGSSDTEKPTAIKLLNYSKFHQLVGDEHRS